jgi:hypothetical protein
MGHDIIVGDIKINDKIMPFYFDGKRLTIRKEADDSAIFFHGSSVKEHHDVVHGVTDNGRYIVFFGVPYEKSRRTIYPQGWATSSGGAFPKPLETFDAVAFTGYSIDAFFTPKRAFARDFNQIPHDERHKQKPIITPRPQDDYVRDFEVTIDNENIRISLCVNAIYKLRRHVRDIGTVTSQLVFKFREPVTINKLPKYYLYAFDFMQFISFRQNISFDSITLFNNSDDSKIGLYEIANGEFYTRDYEHEYQNTDLNAITFEDIEPSMSALFEYVASHRLRGVVTDVMYIPLSESDYKTVDYLSFLSCSLSFEGEFNRCYPNQKANTNPLFLQVKENILSNISYDKIGNFALTGKDKKKAMKYHNRFIRAIEMTDNTLEEKFNHLCELYGDIVSDFIKRALDEKCVDYTEKSNLGNALSAMRNSIGHGDPGTMEDIHAVAFRITRCLIYAMILDQSGVPRETIKRIIEKIM